MVIHCDPQPMGSPTSGTDFGGRLRRAREARGVSLRQIATVTKISVGVLEALERGDISRLPGGIFSRAFVRSYAQQVGLDAEATVREFLEVFPDETIAAGSPLAVEQYTRSEEQLFATRQRVARTVLWLMLVSVPLGALLLYFSVWRGQPAVAPTGAGSQTPGPAVPADIAASPGPDAMPVAATPEATDTAEAPPSAPATTDDVAQAMPAPPPAPQAAPSGPPEANQPTTGEPPAGAAAALPPAREVLPAVAPPLRIEIEPTSSCWVSLTVDGNLVVSRVMQPGERIIRRVETEAVVAVGDAAAFSFTLNGRPGRPLGGAGEVRTLRITPANYESFVQ
jgi:cytoskeleton protein RodZ